MKDAKFFLGKHLLPDAYKTPVLRQWLLLLAECTLIPLLFLAAPTYWYLILPPEERKDWYSLTEVVIPQGIGVIWRIEATRWLIFSLHLCLQMVLTRRISKLVPQLIAAWSHLRVSMNLKEDSFSSSFEVMAECAGYFFNFIGSVSLYLLSLHLFKTDPKERLWQYFLQASLLLVVVISGGVALEKVILHNLVLEFHRTVYQERVFKSMWAGWVVKTLRSFVQHCKNSGAKTVGDANTKTWQVRACPHRPNSNLLSAFLLESAAAKGQKKQAVEEIATFFGGAIDEAQLVQVFKDAEVGKRAFTWLSEGAESELKSTAALIDRELLGHSIGIIYKERQDLIRALKTHANIVTKLDRVMLWFMAGLILYFGILPIFGYSSLDKDFLLPLGISLAPVYNISRVLGRSIQSFCEAIVYIVSSHPYDVGDRVTIDGVDFYVHEIGLIATTFKRFDGFLVYIPNYVLSKKVLLNIRRTGPQAHRIEILVDFKTPMSAVQSISDQMKAFIRTESRDFDSLISSFFELKPESNHLALVFLLKHRFNFQDGVQRAERVNKFLFRLKTVMEEAGVDYEPPIMRAALEEIWS